MAAIEIKDIVVYKAPASINSKRTIEEKVLIVLNLVSDAPGCVIPAYWRIDFIGTTRDYFLNYAEVVSNAVMDREITCPPAEHECNMHTFLYKCSKGAKEISASALHAHGLLWYGWSIDQMKALNNKNGFIHSNNGGDIRFSKPLLNDKQVSEMLVEAMELGSECNKAAARHYAYRNTPYFDLHPNLLGPTIEEVSAC